MSNLMHFQDEVAHLFLFQNKMLKKFINNILLQMVEDSRGVAGGGGGTGTGGGGTGGGGEKGKTSSMLEQLLSN